MDIVDLAQLKEKEVQEKFEAWLGSNKEISLTGNATYQVFKEGYIAAETPSGNQYNGYLKEQNKTWEKVRDDEPVFILRAQDNTAPGIVLQWISQNLDTVDEAKLKEAFHTVLAMRRYHSRRDPT